jgi:hypothetical protein
MDLQRASNSQVSDDHAQSRTSGQSHTPGTKQEEQANSANEKVSNAAENPNPPKTKRRGEKFRCHPSRKIRKMPLQNPAAEHQQGAGHQAPKQRSICPPRNRQREKKQNSFHAAKPGPNEPIPSMRKESTIHARVITTVPTSKIPEPKGMYIVPMTETLAEPEPRISLPRVCRYAGASVSRCPCCTQLVLASIRERRPGDQARNPSGSITQDKKKKKKTTEKPSAMVSGECKFANWCKERLKGELARAAYLSPCDYRVPEESVQRGRGGTDRHFGNVANLCGPACQHVRCLCRPFADGELWQERCRLVDQGRLLWLVCPPLVRRRLLLT